MGLPRFYHPADLFPDHNTMLSESAARHAGLALRLSVGDQISLFNGDGCEYLAEIINITRKQTQIKILAKNKLSRESDLTIHLFQGISKTDKMDFVIQKAVELGVTEITPVITQYCAVKLIDKVILKKQQHWHNIIISACEQSGRNMLPKLNNIILLADIFKNLNNLNLNLILDPEGKQKFSEINNPQNNSINNKINILIGPEGGFSPIEINHAEQNGFLSVRIGSRILRTETAAIAALSATQSRWGDF